MPVTVEAASLTLKDLMRVHPLWLSRKDDWTTIEAMRTKRMDYRKYLPVGAIEDPADHTQRLQMTRFVPESMAARGRAVGAVFDTQANRDQVPENIREWSRSVDRSRRSLEHWMEIQAVPIMLDFGACHVLVDRPKMPEGAPAPESAADEDAMDLTVPFLVAYSPLSVRNWSVNERGGLEWVLIVEDGWASIGPLGSRVPARTYRLFDQVMWHSWTSTPTADDKQLQTTTWQPNGDPDERSQKSEKLVGTVESGPHGSEGEVPVACFMAEPDTELLGRSLIEDAVELDLKRLQLESDQTWDLWLHAHPLLWLRSTASPSEMALGSTKYIHLNPEGDEEVGYAAPPSESFQARERAIHQVLNDTYRHTGVDPLGILTQDAGPTEASGVARAWSYKTSEGRHITRLRDRVEEGENRVYQIVAKFLGSQALPEPNPSQWPNEYETETTAESIENASAAKPLLRVSPTATRILTKRVALRSLGDLTMDQRLQIESEIDSASDEELAPSFSMPGSGIFDDQDEDAQEGSGSLQRSSRA